MPITKVRAGIEMDDEAFDSIYPQHLQVVSEFHFTPLKVAMAAAAFLVENPGDRVLDIGSGAGKFCLVGAACTPGHFVGVEQRESLHRISVELAERYDLKNTDFHLANFLDHDFKPYKALYFFNSFQENIVPDSAIDNTVMLNREYYKQYARQLRERLGDMPTGTRLATFFSYLTEVPDCYELRDSAFDRKLKLWVRT